MMDELGKSSDGRTWQRVGLGLLFSSCAVAFWIGTGLTNKTRARAKIALSIPSERLDFGEVWETEKFSWEVPINNATNQDITVTAFQASCSCVSIEPQSVVVPAQGQSKVKLLLDLRSRRDEMRWRFKEHLAAQLPDDRETWQIVGTVKRAVSLSSRLVDLGETYVDGPQLTAKIKATANVPLQDLNVLSAFPVLSGKRQLAQKNEYEIGLTLDKVPEARQIESTLVVIPIGEKGERLTATDVTVRAIVRENVESIPRNLVLGAAQLGREYRETIVLRSANKRSFRIVSAQGVPEAAVEALPSGAVDHCVLQVIVKPAKEGDQTVLVNIAVVEEGTGRKQTVSLPIVYCGYTTRKG